MSLVKLANVFLSSFDAKLVRKSRIDNPPDLQTNVSKIIFFHPPKCAGTSVTSAFRNMVGHNRFQSISATFSIDSLATQEAARQLDISSEFYREQLALYGLASNQIRFIHGHLLYSERLKKNSPEDTCFVTMLRNPIDRVLSLYYFNRHKSNEYRFGADKTLQEWLKTSDAQSAATIFVRFFNGDVEKSLDIMHSCCDETDINSCVERSIANLKQFDIVGIVEKLPDFEQAVYDKLNVKIKLERNNSNPATYPSWSEHPKSVRDQIYKLCQPDVHIYEKMLEQYTDNRKI